MANNKAIQILRTNSDGIINSKKDIELLDGQPFYNKQKNYLTVGHKTDGTVNQEPITVRKLVGYFDDKGAVGNGTSQGYSIEPDDDNDTTLKISTTTGNILIDAFQNGLNAQDRNFIVAVNTNNITATGNNGKNTLEAYENNMIAANSNCINAGASDQVGNNYIRTGYFDEDKNEFIPNMGNNYIEAGSNILNATSGNSITTSIGDNNIEAAVNFLNARIRNDITAPANNITATGNNNVTADSGGNFIIAKNSPQNYGNQIIATDNCVGGNIIKAGAGGNIIEAINNGGNTIIATGAGGSNTIEATGASGCNTITAGTNTIEAVNNTITAGTNNIEASTNNITAGTGSTGSNAIKATGSGSNNIEATNSNVIKVVDGNGTTKTKIETNSSEIILATNDVIFTNGFNEPQDDKHFPVLFSDVDNNADAFIGKHDVFTYNPKQGELKTTSATVTSLATTSATVTTMAYGTSNTTDTTVVNLGSMMNYTGITHQHDSNNPNNPNLSYSTLLIDTIKAKNQKSYNTSGGDGPTIMTGLPNCSIEFSKVEEDNKVTTNTFVALKSVSETGDDTYTFGLGSNGNLSYVYSYKDEYDKDINHVSFKMLKDTLTVDNISAYTIEVDNALLKNAYIMQSPVLGAVKVYNNNALNNTDIGGSPKDRYYFMENLISRDKGDLANLDSNIFILPHLNVGEYREIWAYSNKEDTGSTYVNVGFECYSFNKDIKVDFIIWKDGDLIPQICKKGVKVVEMRIKYGSNGSTFYTKDIYSIFSKDILGDLWMESKDTHDVYIDTGYALSYGDPHQMKVFIVRVE